MIMAGPTLEAAFTCFCSKPGFSLKQCEDKSEPNSIYINVDAAPKCKSTNTSSAIKHFPFLCASLCVFLSLYFCHCKGPKKL